MKKLCFIMTVVLCMSCSQESPITKTTVDEIQYSKDDYQHELGRFAGLDEDTEWQIVQAYYKKIKSNSRSRNNDLTINDITVEDYYGSYCPCYLFPVFGTETLDFLRTGYLDVKNQIVPAVKVRVKGTDYSTEQRDVIVKIPGSSWNAVIRYYDNNSVLLWDKEKLFDLEKDDLFYIQKEGDSVYEIPLLAAWDFRKIINRHNGLDVETDTLIREDIGKYILTGWLVEDYASINMKYLGTYNGYVALTLYGGTLPAAREQIIDGVLFYFPYMDIRVLAWKDRLIYELEEPFNQGLITHEDLVEMAYFHSP